MGQGKCVVESLGMNPFEARARHAEVAAERPSKQARGHLRVTDRQSEFPR